PLAHQQVPGRRRPRHLQRRWQQVRDPQVRRPAANSVAHDAMLTVMPFPDSAVLSAAAAAAVAPVLGAAAPDTVVEVPVQGAAAPDVSVAGAPDAAAATAPDAAASATPTAGAPELGPAAPDSAAAGAPERGRPRPTRRQR